MRYKKSDKGFNVCEEGVVYLPQLKEHHYVKNGSIVCNGNLCRYSWQTEDIPKDSKLCPLCFRQEQLKLF